MSVPARSRDQPRGRRHRSAAPRRRPPCLHHLLGRPCAAWRRSTARIPACAQSPALDDGRVLLERLVDLALAVDVGRDQDQRRIGFGALDVFFEASRSLGALFILVPSSGSSAALPLRFGFRIRSARSTMTTRRSPSIGIVRAASTIVDAGDRLSRSRSSRSRLKARARLRRDAEMSVARPRHLRLVVADDQIERIRSARGDLLAQPSAGVAAGIRTPRGWR